MSVTNFLTGDPRRQSALYLGIGVLSLLKAIAVRNDRTRFRRELLDAGVFIAVGLLLRRYGRLKTTAEDRFRERVPGVLRESEPEPEPTLASRARGAIPLD